MAFWVLVSMCYIVSSAQLEAEGMDVTRVDLLPLTAGTRQHLATYNEMDVSLDPFPYTGTTTTAESLVMGVPVVTLTGPWLALAALPRPCLPVCWWRCGARCRMLLFMIDPDPFMKCLACSDLLQSNVCIAANAYLGYAVSAMHGPDHGKSVGLLAFLCPILHVSC